MTLYSKIYIFKLYNIFNGGNMKRIFIFIFLFYSIFFISGCSGKIYTVGIDSISSEEFSLSDGKKYYFLPSDKELNRNHLYFQEVCRLIKPYFEDKNMIITEEIYNTDYVIFLGYGISEPKERIETYNIPQMGITGYNTYTYGNMMSTYNNSDSFGTYNAQSYTTPTYGIVGYTQEINTYTEYERWLGMTAYDLDRSKKDIKLGKQVWKTFIQSIGSSGDFRQVLPYMLQVLPENLAKNSHGYIWYEVEDYSEALDAGLRDYKIVVRKRK